jgi:hypothetical protein
MGCWDLIEPWGNDAAADFFGVLFEESRFREKVMKALEEPADWDNHEKVRAAASILLFVGRVYVWPIGTWKADIRLAIERLTEVLEVDIVKEDAELADAIRSERDILKWRLDKSEHGPDVALDKASLQHWKRLV